MLWGISTKQGIFYVALNNNSSTASQNRTDRGTIKQRVNEEYLKETGFQSNNSNTNKYK